MPEVVLGVGKVVKTSSVVIDERMGSGRPVDV